MSMIPDEVIEQVRDAADLVALIGESVELKRTGADYRGPCPFHGGVHRNFAVIPRKGRYYCFVCKESGDVFSWYMKRFGMDYPGAVREVARHVGIVIPESTGRQGPDPREPLFQAVAAAHDWFTRQLRELPEAADARQYLLGRKLDLDTVGPFELGYAPRGAAFAKAMTALGLSEEVLLEAGLLARREDGSVIPRFRARLLFPIHDIRGRVVGFGGRLLGPGEPKYLNSPESPIFKKGATLYNLHAARNAIRKEGFVVLVEGYFDVLRLVLAGCEHVVAPLGTALTPDQATLLRRYTDRAVLLLDSDMAGLRATFRAGDELLRHQFRVGVATLPAGEDPDTLVLGGGLAALEKILADQVDVMERKIQILDRRGWFGDIEHRREALDRLLPTIRATRDPIQRELYLTLVAQRTGVEKKVLEHEAAEPERRPEIPGPRPVPSPAAADAPGPQSEWGRTELKLLRLLLASGSWRSSAGRLPAQLFEDPINREIFERLGHGEATGPLPPPPDLGELARARWQACLDQGAPVAEAAMDEFFADACARLESRPSIRRLREISRLISRTRGEELSVLMAERRRIQDQLESQYPAWRAYYPLTRHSRGRPSRPAAGDPMNPIPES